MSVDMINLKVSLPDAASNVKDESTKISSSGKSNDNFSSVVKKVQADNGNKKIQKQDTQNTTDTGKDEKKAEIETYLKKAGFTDEEIKTIEDKIDNGQIDKDSILSLLSLLFSSNADIQSQLNNVVNDKNSASDSNLQVIGSIADNNSDKKLDFLQAIDKSVQLIADKLSDNSTIQDVKNAVDSAVDENMGILKDILSSLGNVDKSEQLAGKLSKKIADNVMLKLNQFVSGNKTSIDGSDIKSAIYEELLSKLDVKLQDTPQVQQVKDGLNNIKLYQQVDTVNKPAENVNIQNSLDSEDGNSFAEGKDNDTLSKILGDSKGESKISRAVNFMTQFNSIKGDNSSIQGQVQNMTVNKDSFSSDLIKSIKYMELNNVKELTVKVTPKELGNITINLVMEEGRMKAVLTASNKDTYNILNSNLQDMSNKLQSNEIKVQNFSLNLYHEDTTFFKGGNGRGQEDQDRKGGHLNSIEGNIPEEEPEDDYYSENNVNILA
ncbi:MAG: flagellar hook-length control protein FliK [Clostridium sp.]|jgi:flagellar hook-length control protein FliK|uniref:flagellar hook-length control protein FliK n=1 Tax=Clostridium sp. TaxID=1506 RepID=UPI0025BB4630|nr:flagellar hook-length control protein FliK [Clostridium sp.]MCH3964221.1 flagellar hook-length control protein FliK [Clostridium sp.]MCI1715402.1 flagellar hook-length control protein FliK [Clostridium sp.]MCI1799807.1 flagellar hook-length control protein FliK [Clostridium sp.]MCI1813585.1 flagellar hook-length control protein FliK [Clostridium sp.]MCI1870625.1 flagellar hook-length control protein FliK [Clostridium sp.]